MGKRCPGPGKGAPKRRAQPSDSSPRTPRPLPKRLARIRARATAGPDPDTRSRRDGGPSRWTTAPRCSSGRSPRHSCRCGSVRAAGEDRCFHPGIRPTGPLVTPGPRPGRDRSARGVPIVHPTNCCAQHPARGAPATTLCSSEPGCALTETLSRHPTPHGAQGCHALRAGLVWLLILRWRRRPTGPSTNPAAAPLSGRNSGPGDVARGQRNKPSSLPAHQVAQLKQLADLHQQGALTDAEFRTAKARVLNEG